jgi:transposase
LVQPLGGKQTKRFARFAPKWATQSFVRGGKKKIVSEASHGVVNIALWCFEWLKVLGKKASKYTIMRILRAEEFSWRRVRKSLKSQRDEIMFEFFKQEIKVLRQEHQSGKISLWFYDEAGFNRNPNGVYAWLSKGSQTSLPSQRGNVTTVAGFFQTDNTLQAYECKGSMDSDLFIAFVDDFLQQYPPSVKTIVIIDNASFHKSAQVKKKIEQWQKKNLFFQFLPPYCSELNLIEILWHHMKHLWLKIEDYTSEEMLKKAINHIIENIKTKYTITFA